jgi:predicted nucleic acid-binding protein
VGTPQRQRRPELPISHPASSNGDDRFWALKDINFEVIAATAWAKNLPLLTRNRKDFEHIKEITLSPVYDIE